MNDTVRIAVADRIARITLDRVAKKNALTTAMYGTLAEALPALDADPAVRVIVIGGAGGVFTAGNDLDDFVASAQRRAGAEPAAFAVLRALAVLEKPLIASVGGLAIGIGSTLLLHCDAVYCAPEARFQFPFCNLGLVPEAASSLLLPRFVGGLAAAELLLFGDMIGAERALALGLVSAILPAADLEAHVDARAAALAAKPAESLRITKRLLKQADRPDVQARMEEELILFRRRLAEADFAEAVTAFREKRPPRFG